MEANLRCEGAGACTASHTYIAFGVPDLNIRINCMQILKEFGAMLLLSVIGLPASVAFSYAAQQAMLSTRGNMWPLILDQSSKMSQVHVPSV